ncbi:MAG: plasmid stabilization protein [Proteobacteria bacterium]|nr:plasmid stabilization protein [Pseudomonadota bacterium]
MKTIVLTNAAAKQFDALPSPVRSAVSAGLDAYAIHGRGDVKALKDRPGYRLRVGRYRVIFTEDMTTILAIHIGPRQTGTYR